MTMIDSGLLFWATLYKVNVSALSGVSALWQAVKSIRKRSCRWRFM